MTTRIGIISDIHATIAPLQEALQIFRQQQVDLIICAGDIAGYGEDELSKTVSILKQNNCQMIIGNHDQLSELPAASSHELISFFDSLPAHLEFEYESKKIYVVHASPPEQLHGGIKLLDKNGELIEARLKEWRKKLSGFEYDILIVGHTHQTYAQQINNTLIINPGSTAYNNSCMILNLPEMTVSSYALQNKAIIKSWNWGLFYTEKKHSGR